MNDVIGDGFVRFELGEMRDVVFLVDGCELSKGGEVIFLILGELVPGDEVTDFCYPVIWWHS